MSSAYALSLKRAVGLTVMELPREVMHYFPYDSVRPRQDQFINTVFDAIRDRRSVLIEGSNGLGKTISALSACLPIAVEKDLKILYVARTHRQHDRVIEELGAVFKKYSVSGISLRGRHEMCLNNTISGNDFDSKSLMEACELLKAKGRCPYYKKSEERTYDYLQLQHEVAARPYKASEIQRVCRKKEVCPYELAKGSLSDIKVVALSYLYVFDPVIRNAFLKNLDSQLQKIILIVDEAHNLPETAIDISSSSLSLFVIKQAELEASRFENKEIETFIGFFRSQIEKMTERIGKEEIISPESLIEIIQKQGNIAKPREFIEHLHEVGGYIRKTLLGEGKNPRSYIHGMSEFLLRWLETLGDESFVHVASKHVARDGAKTARLEIVALDPSKVTMPVFSNTYSNIVMSGTLQPLQAYQRITGLPENTVQCIVPSPFPKEHVLSLVCLGVTTAMEKRTTDMYKIIVERVAEVAENTPGNTGIFAASFEVLNSMVAEGLENCLSKPLFHEKRGMSSRLNEKMVAAFKDCGDHEGAVFLGVQGGRTSEGVDFPGNQMNSVAIVGVPYAEPTPTVKAQISYYEKCFPNLGREYGYVLPAMKKASQAAGRPIRTLEDRGAIVFLDYRFATGYCRSFLPSWINNGLKILPFSDKILAQEIHRFFDL